MKLPDTSWKFVRKLNKEDAGGFYTIEDAAKNVLAHECTLEEIGVAWRRIDGHTVIAEKLVRQTAGGSNRLLSLT